MDSSSAHRALIRPTSLAMRSRSTKIKHFIGELENLQIIGRYGTFRYNNTDHSIETGLLAAKNILGESHDLDQVNADKEYHEIKRVAEPVAAGRS